MFYFLNGYRFEYDDKIRELLKRLGTDEAADDEERTIEYLLSRTEERVLTGEIEDWHEDVIQYGLEELNDDLSDPND